MGMAQKARLDAYALRELQETKWQQNNARIDAALANLTRIDAETAELNAKFFADMREHLGRIEGECQP